MGDVPAGKDAPGDVPVAAVTADDCMALHNPHTDIFSRRSTGSDMRTSPGLQARYDEPLSVLEGVQEGDEGQMCPL